MSEQGIRLDKQKSEAVLAEVVRRLGLNREQIIEGSLFVTWDSERAEVRWEGFVPLSPDEAADIFTTALTSPEPTP